MKLSEGLRVPYNLIRLPSGLQEGLRVNWPG